MTTDEQIEELAQKLHLSKSQQEAAAHKQGIVPWGELGETYRHSLRQMAKEQLDGQQ